MSKTAILGFPRIGANRELKKVLERYWEGRVGREELLQTSKEIRVQNWKLQKEAGIDFIPSNDFSFYDQVLDTSMLVGAIPDRYKDQSDLDLYFAMARGCQKDVDGKKVDVTAMEMTKWFDTNYHYLVPELHEGQKFSLSSNKPFEHFEEAIKLGIKTRPVLIGPFSYLKLSKVKGKTFDIFTLLPSLVEVYQAAIKKLSELGADWIQLDEPYLALDRSEKEIQMCGQAFEKLKQAAGKTQLMLVSYFESSTQNFKAISKFGADAYHIDLTYGTEGLNTILNNFPEQALLSAGVVNGRNIWKNNFGVSLDCLNEIKSKIGADRLTVSSSCSLMHSPIDLDMEKGLNPKLKACLSFAKQKLHEIVILAKAVEGKASATELENNQKSAAIRKTFGVNSKVTERLKSLKPEDSTRKSPFKTRSQVQAEKLKLPHFPTTTIGSFPQTGEIRQARAKFKKKQISENEYKHFLQEKTCDVIQKQNEIDLDVLVHGEFERNDMVEYFGEQLDGFAFTQNGWVQSYGSRCVKPPVLYGDVSRPEPMTVEWAKYAQSQSNKIMKGMLTGPITILQWSFVRDDQPRSTTAFQIALAIRDEVVDLEKAGIAIIQIDEAALREGLPLRKSKWKEYLSWAIKAFRIATSGVKDQTQIHTHMCYSEFNDILDDIAKMDADVITIETSRSQSKLLEAFKKFNYPNGIGPGVYDIHSPRIPSVKEMEDLLLQAGNHLPLENIWVNPDCGLKTRKWEETLPALKSMVQAAKNVRSKVNEK